MLPGRIEFLRLNSIQHESRREKQVDDSTNLRGGNTKKFLGRHAINYRADEVAAASLLSDQELEDSLLQELSKQKLPFTRAIKMTLDEVKQHLLYNYKEVAGNSDVECLKARACLSGKSQTLHDFLKRILQDDRLKRALQRNFASLETSVAEISHQVQLGKCPMVFARNNRLLNILLQEQDLQRLQNVHAESSSICEIKYGEERQFRERPQQSRAKANDDFRPHDHLSDDRRSAISSSKCVKHKIFEFCLPVEFLKCGVVLVDTPAVTRDTDIKRFVNNNLQDCVIFVVVLTDAIQIYQKSLSSSLIDQCDYEKLLEAQEIDRITTPTDWETIKEGSTLNEAAQSVGQCHVSNTETHKIIDATDTKHVDNFGEEFVRPQMQGHAVENAKRTALMNTLHIQTLYRFLQDFLARVEYHTLLFCTYTKLIDASYEKELKGENLTVEKKRKILCSKAKKQHSKFQKYVQNLDYSQIADSLRLQLEPPAVRESLVAWIDKQCSSTEFNFEQAEQCVKTRFVQLLEKWENDTKMLQKQRKAIEKHLSQQLREFTMVEPVEINLPELEFRLLEVKRSIMAALQPSFVNSFNITSAKKFTFSSNPKDSKELIKKMVTDTLTDLHHKTLEVVKQLLGVTNAVKVFKEEVDKKLEMTLNEFGDLPKRKRAEQFIDTYETIAEESSKFRAEYFQWEFDHLLERDFLKSSSVTLDSANGRYLLGSGSIFAFYRGIETVNGQEVPVTVKRYASKYNLETAVRDYKHLKREESSLLGRVKGIVKLDFESLAGADPEIAVVMETCAYSLHEFLTNTSNLGGYNLSSVLTLTLPLAHDICDGLNALHNACSVHGDLTPSTVLLVNKSPLSEGTEVTPFSAKLCHSGFSNGLRLPRQNSFCLPSSKYSAPEIIDFVAYEPSMDVYSFGQILSDLWYGNNGCAFTERPMANAQTIEKGFAYSDHEDRLQFKEPTREYKQLIIKCCQKLAANRPSIAEIEMELNDISTNTQ